MHRPKQASRRFSRFPAAVKTWDQTSVPFVRSDALFLAERDGGLRNHCAWHFWAAVHEPLEGRSCQRCHRTGDATANGARLLVRNGTSQLGACFTGERNMAYIHPPDSAESATVGHMGDGASGQSNTTTANVDRAAVRLKPEKCVGHDGSLVQRAPDKLKMSLPTCSNSNGLTVVPDASTFVKLSQVVVDLHCSQGGGEKERETDKPAAWVVFSGQELATRASEIFKLNRHLDKDSAARDGDMTHTRPHQRLDSRPPRRKAARP
ncbi:hypothetical protein CSOJ01_06709 [Colletotrichum sojae]|uniref:Uncharacterized protein n=1 Tax=Colletotrichum sojae TaxID=2175907 RepID=A0A8H6JAX9_9PEZI|nr:hypothetical protein CSOJ01_06709 [Colletotrichum sojae]